MEKHTVLSPRERQFCNFYVLLGSPAEAAEQAGYRGERAAGAAARLLARSDVREEIERQRADTRRQAEMDALAGLRRLALGPRNDAVCLATGRDIDMDQLHALDLFGVAEIKQAKDGGCDVKFIDRLQALTLLLDYGRAVDSGTPGSLLGALEQSARALATGCGHDAL